MRSRLRLGYCCPTTRKSYATIRRQRAWKIDRESHGHCAVCGKWSWLQQMNTGQATVCVFCRVKARKEERRNGVV